MKTAEYQSVPPQLQPPFEGEQPRNEQRNASPSSTEVAPSGELSGLKERLVEKTNDLLTVRHTKRPEGQDPQELLQAIDEGTNAQTVGERLRLTWYLL